MKKVIAFFMCALICLSVCACTSKKTNHDASSSGASYKEQTSSEAETSSEQSSSSEDTSTKLPQKTSSKDNASKNTNSKNTSSKKNTLNNDRRPIDTWLTPTIPSGNTSSKGNVSYVAPEPEFVLGKDYGAIVYQGDLVEMICDKDIVYSIFKSPNMLVAYDSNSFQIVKQITLPGSPAEIHIEGQQIQISIPNLQCINTYDKNSLEQVKSIVLPNSVISFCIDGDLVYYSGGSNGGNIYRTNILTEDTEQLPGYPYASKLFLNPKLLLNREKGILYIGESNSNSSSIFYYKTSGLSCLYKSETVNNGARTMFLANDKLYWGPMILDPVNPAGSEEYYMSTSAKAELWHVDNDYVINADKINKRNFYLGNEKLEGFGRSVMTGSKNLVVSYVDYEGKFIFTFPKGVYGE